MEREVTPARSQAGSSVRPTPCVLWLPPNDTPPNHLVRSLENLGLKVIIARHRYAALAEAIVASKTNTTTENQPPTPPTSPALTVPNPIAVVLVEPDRLADVDSFRDALSRLQTPIARWRYDPNQRPAFARDETNTTNQSQSSSAQPTNNTIDTGNPPTPTPPTSSTTALSPSAPPASWLRLVHDEELTEPPPPHDRPIHQDNNNHQPTQPPQHSAPVQTPASHPTTPDPSPTQPTPAQHTPPLNPPPPERITLTDDELAMLLADDDEFRRLEQRHANRPPQQPNHRPSR